MSVDLSFVSQAVGEHGRTVDATIPILQALQERYGYLPREAMERVCELTEITAAHIVGVATFYSQFRLQPVGKHMISVCHGTACHVKGGGAVYEAFRRELGLAGEADTDTQGLFTLRKVACLGCCTLAPAVQIDRVTYGHMTPRAAAGVLRDFLSRDLSLAQESPVGPSHSSGQILIGLGSCCVARGSQDVRKALVEAIAWAGAEATVKQVGCVGMCHQTPLVEVRARDAAPAFYARVRAQDARAIVTRHFGTRGLLRRAGHAASAAIDWLMLGRTERTEALDKDQPQVEAFLQPQVHIATEHSGAISPLDLEEYLSHDGFAALERARKLGPEAVIDEIHASGLAGRGGAGFPTGVKWEAVRESHGPMKYVICNGDEGDPGAFMDRMLLESYPYRVIEGMVIAAEAVGAAEGIFYIRAEYPLAVERVRAAIDRCRQAGLLGELKLRIEQGAGAFVCGEETALIASLEGGRGMPRLRPPYPAQRGLHGLPTLVNNVETLALAPWIVRNGGASFAAMGTEHSKGTKVFALAGKVVRGGLIEVPMGMTIRRIVQEIGGGVGEGHVFKAVQIGGPSGGCLPADLADTPVDYLALKSVGAIMGSGGLVVLDEGDCMVDIARYFLQFTQNQSCGRCTFCRIGTRRMLDILDGLCEGRPRAGDLEELERLGHAIKSNSLCGLGKTAPNPVLTTLKYFRSEYEAHLQCRCPAGKCKALIQYEITDECIGCTICAQNCPADAIEMRPYEKHEIDQTKCVKCDTCRVVCPSQAVHRRDRRERREEDEERE
jgi:NADH-quinone oxidoreductase subunit F